MDDSGSWQLGVRGKQHDSIRGKGLYLGVGCMICNLLLMVELSQGRILYQSRTLQAYTDSTDTAMHGPAVKSFRVSDGGWVDCVRVEEQIAAHHPSLKDHVIQMQPSSKLHQKSFEKLPHHPQLFGREHGKCPQGTIPVQRRSSMKPFLTKKQGPKMMMAMSQPDTIPASTSAVKAHEYAVVEMPTSTGTYGGGGSYLSVNYPSIEDSSVEFSLSQLWVVAGRYNDSSVNTAEVGWQTYPLLHPNDSPLSPHLFIYWTADAYKETGCYNLECGGFVQTSNSWVIGGTMGAYTTLSSNTNFEYNMGVLVVYDSSSGGKWWLYISGEAIGYWPSSIYTTMKSGADIIEWGGEIVPSSKAARHTTTAMGSGAFPAEGYPKSAFQRNLTVADLLGNQNNADSLTKFVTNANCYDSSIQQGNFNNWGTYFFFGGSGGDHSTCV